ncbi:hypothetical protein MUK42_26441 [Musa troglodytarum]|uniref:Uncharacterized protein n=1 Tax=Musa troglodytarum TaxID=320322 RepID=A0A9E7F0X9_9LILI|nr:hypothetical protein MUK42_26441 [Musa troglodytarum]
MEMSNTRTRWRDCNQSEVILFLSLWTLCAMRI